MPTQTVTAYTLPTDAPFKIQTTGSAGAGQYLSSPQANDPYTFGGSGNVFIYYPDVGFGRVGFQDQTLGTPAVYDQSGRVIPLQNGFGSNLFCTIQSRASGGQQQTCPLTCREFDVSPSEATWNCGGQWYSRNTGSCSTFQAYVISQ